MLNQGWLAFEKLIALLGGRTIAMLAVALLIAVVSVLYSDKWIQSIDHEGRVIGQIRTNIVILNQLKTNLYKAESAQRGYLYSQREPHVEPFTQALNDARNNIAKIETLVIRTSTDKEQAEQQVWMKAISASLEAKAAEMKMTLNLARTGKAQEARQVMNLDEGLIEMQKLMEYTDIVIGNQNKILETKLAERRHTILMARLSIFGGALLLVWIVVLVIKQLLEEIAIKSELQQSVIRVNVIYEEKLKQQTKLLRSLALDYQADVERERQKLAVELHDELGSIFTATKMDISWVIKKMKDIKSDTAAEVANKLRKTNSYVDQGIQYKRNIVQELHPSILTTFGFWPALKSLIEDATERNQWELTLSLPDENTHLNETLSLIVYRIAQETLNNANKYAKATKVSIHVIVDSQYVKLEIEDNGVGFDMNALDGRTHGLSGMRHRVLAIGGHLEIISDSGKGVLTRALIPLDFETI